MDSTHAMNEISTHPKLKVQLLLRQGVTSAGSTLSALLEVDSRAEFELGLGTMIVELVGTEELISKSTTLRAIFIHEINRFQGKDLPPSNICHPIQDARFPFPKGHWPAREGKCSFPISFLLPSTLPSSLCLLPNKLARITYSLRSSISLSYKGQTAVLVTSRDVPVVGILDELDGQGEGGWGGEGEEWIGPNEVVWEGKISNPTLTITRRLLLPSPPTHNPTSKTPHTHELVVSDVVLTTPFRGNQFEFLPNTETVVPLEILIPEDLRSLRAGKRDDGRGRGGKRDALFEVRCVVEVKVSTGVLGKDIHLELPVFVAHPASLPPAFLDRVPPLHPTIAPPQTPFPQPWIQATRTGSPQSYNYPPPPPFHPTQQQQRSSSAMSFHPPQTPLPPSTNAWPSGVPSPGTPFITDSPVGMYSPSVWDSRAASVAPAPSSWGVQPYGGGSRPPSSMGYAPQQQWQAPPPPPRPSSAMDAYSPVGGGWQGYAPPFSSQAAPALPSPNLQQHHHPNPPPRSSTTPAPHEYYHNHPPPPPIPQQVISPQAERISHHLRDSSKTRGRSVSPPRSNLVSFLDAAVEPWQQEQIVSLSPRPPSSNGVPVDSNFLRRVNHVINQPPPRSAPSPAPGFYGQRQPPSTVPLSSHIPPGFVPYHEVLSPKAISLPELAHGRGYFDAIGEAGESTAGGTMKSVAELERMVEEQAELFVVDGKIVGPLSWNSTREDEDEDEDEDEERRRRRREEAINKTLPPPPVPSIRTKPSVLGNAGGGKRETVVPVKPSLLEAFEKAAEEKERRKERRKEGERNGGGMMGAGSRRSSADVRGGAGKVDASVSVPRSTTMPALAASSTTTPPASPVSNTPATRDATPKVPNPPAILPLPSSSKSPVPPAPEPPRTPTTSQSAAAAVTAKPSPRSATTSLAPTKSALAEIERLKKIKGDRVGAWLGGAVLAKGRGDDSEGTIRDGKRREIVVVEDVPATGGGGGRKSGEREREREKEKVVVASQAKPPTSSSVVVPSLKTAAPTPQPTQPQPMLAARTSFKSISLDVAPSASPVLRPTNESDPEIVVPAKFASRFKKTTQVAGIGMEEKQKYDGRSARGGKGGKVADVTKIWATVIDSETKPSTTSAPSSTTKPKVPPTTPTSSTSKPTSSSRSTPFLAKAPSSTPTTSTSASVPSTITTSLPAPPRNLIKSTSAPVFLNTAGASKASLSSAASLMSPSWTKTKPTTPREKPTSTTIGTLDKSFSKAKLKELRDRYGG
ncbi:hypothetical protein BDY24DRAFT_369433 [Mrakia frigida]|uniref:uncharacterized protein n=1 Tax=Mrakia frigida TaxID=29902 RepID=UPI003FCC24C5